MVSYNKKSKRNFHSIHPQQNHPRTIQMSSYQQSHLNSQQSSKYIEAQKIFPKRLGTYQNGNALVLEYYNLATDKFKKHVIPLDHTKSVKENLEIIYKSPKHGVLLRKVEPRYVENVLKGESVIGQAVYSSEKQSFSGYESQSQPRPSYENISHRPSSYVSNQHSPQQQSSNFSHFSNKQNFSNDNSVSSIIQPKNSQNITQQAKQKISEVEDYYEQEFEDFEISQSMGKKAQAKKQTAVDFSVNSNPANNSVSMPLQSKYDDGGQEEGEKKEKKEKKAKKSKDSKKAKKKKDQLQEDEFDFDFLDGDGVAKKPVKAKDSSSKEKTKTKEKAKQKSKQKQKQKQKQKTTNKEEQKRKVQSKAVQETVIQQDFDFDL